MDCTQWEEEHEHLGSISTGMDMKDWESSQALWLPCVRSLPVGKGSRVGCPPRTYPYGSVCGQTARRLYPLLEETVGFRG